MPTLRKDPAGDERKLWFHLRRHNFGYCRQRSCTTGGFIADFRCHKRRLVIEADGGQHADNFAYDEAKREAG
jgi:very-short-patch-repair endonuclease